MRRLGAKDVYAVYWTRAGLTRISARLGGSNGRSRIGGVKYGQFDYCSFCEWRGLIMKSFEDILGCLVFPPSGRNRRVSSNEQPKWNDGNFDMTPLAPGEVLELPPLTGPGVIHHMWFTSHAGGMNELNALSIRIYFDGREIPDVEAPVGDFFAVGQSPAVVESFPVQVSPSGSLTCYWRMPFAVSARIVIRNDNPDRSTGLYWQVDWEELPELPPDTMYFCTEYRGEYPAVMGRDYLIADIRGRGKYVGTVLSVTLAQDGWFGEGDDFFYIDGETVPSLQGTGSEDYFNDAWGFRKRTGLWFGQPRWQGDRAGDCGVCYRWHILDPVGFEESLRVTIEHKGNRPMSEDGWYIERPDFLSSLSFRYQLGGKGERTSLPPYADRCVPWRSHRFVESFTTAVIRGGEQRIDTAGLFGGRPMIRFEAGREGAVLVEPFTICEGGRYAVRITAFESPSCGVYDIGIDGETILRAVDFSSAEAGERDILLGTVELGSGEHTVTFTSLGTGSLSIEMLRLLALPAEANREVKTHNEAHFIRLGIGRAVYAYRLAYGSLPDSLEGLSLAGVLSKRYLADENGFELRSESDGAFFLVESTAPGGWRAKWSGLDARR